MGEGEPIKNGIDSMSTEQFNKFRDQFRKKVIPNVKTEQSEELAKTKKKRDENSDDK